MKHTNLWLDVWGPQYAVLSYLEIVSQMAHFSLIGTASHTKEPLRLEYSPGKHE